MARKSGGYLSLPRGDSPYHRIRHAPLVAHYHLGLGKLYRRTDKRQEAQEYLTTATRMHREMDMRFRLEQAEAEMRALA